MSSLGVPSIEPASTGAIGSDGSNINFIGNISFEGNHAVTAGGKRKFEDS